MLEKKLSAIAGIGEKRAKLLEKIGLFTVRDLLFYVPRDYQDFSTLSPCAGVEEGEQCVIGRVAAAPRLTYPRKNLNILQAQVYDETGSVKLVWYNQAYRKKQLISGNVVLVYGKVSRRSGRATFENPLIEPMEQEGGEGMARGMLPIYRLTAGITQGMMRAMVQICLKQGLGHIQETLPTKLRNAYQLCEINFAIEQVHYPTDAASLEQAKRRLAMEDLFFFLLAITWMKGKRKKEKGIAFDTVGAKEDFLSRLPFELTAGQKKAIHDITMDMQSDAPMNRLIQGDVGAGKTVVAFYAMDISQRNGYQSILLAPTEILARQHLKTAQTLFEGREGIEYFIGGMKKKERESALQRMANGQSKMIIGTHALLQEDVAFMNLGLVVTDEQHRFGVRQRAWLAREKSVDMLIMSATPIPRTLTLILYGDLEVSTMKGLPVGRKAIKTHYVSPKKRRDLYHYVAQEANKDNRTYIVAPLIEESEAILASSTHALYDELKEGALKDIAVGLLHGRMDVDEKTRILDDFRLGKIKVLISTTVIEVGVDIPEATIMVIENADRFGLAQMHQLRGRVGRGEKQSYCFLLSAAQNKETQQRIEILCESNDGFLIAQRDLELRGPGEFLGTKQSGLGDFRMAHMTANLFALEEARAMAQSVLYEQEYEPYRADLLNYMNQLYQKKWQEIAMN